MYPWRLIAMLEQADISFQDLFYPQRLRCPLEKRIVRAIEENWPAYFPTRKECRGSNWSLTIPEDEPLYQPHPKSRQKLAQWKKEIKGTIVEIRAYRADISWRRFWVICRKIPELRPFLKNFKPLADFLIFEESMWLRHGDALVRQEEFFQRQMRVMFATGSPYHHADPNRVRFLNSNRPTMEKIRMADLMCQLFDRPLMILAVLQTCASESPHSKFWLPIQNHIAAIIKTPSAMTFRMTWLEHAMQVSGAIKKTGKSSPRKWAGMLVSEKDPDVNVINAKAVEVHYWLHGRKLPSLKNVRRIGRVIFDASRQNANQADAGKDFWLFSWMITLWLEKHFTEIASEFKNDNRKIQNYYRRFFHYLKIVQPARNGQGAGGLFAHQPCD